MFDSWERMMTMQVFLNAVAEGVSKFLPEPLRYDRSRTKDQVFAPTTASPVSAAALYKLRRAEPCRAPRKFPRVDLPFDVVMTEPRSEKMEEPAAAKDISREPARKKPPAAPPMAAARAPSASPAPRPSLESSGGSLASPWIHRGPSRFEQLQATKS
jgi:hypothetical protein